MLVLRQTLSQSNADLLTRSRPLNKLEIESHPGRFGRVRDALF